MDYFSVTYQPGSKLGLSVSQANGDALSLGNTVVETVEPTGRSMEGGVRQGDMIIAINERYVAFEPNTETVTELRGVMNARKLLEIYFCRPNVTEWERIQKSGTAIIYEGMVQKLHQGLFKKWNPRNISLTRETFSYSFEGVLKGKYSLESQVGRPRVAIGYPSSQGVFEIRVADKEFILQTNSSNSRNILMHNIECALNKVYARMPPNLPQARPYSVSGYPMHSAGQGPPAPSNEGDVGSSYLMLGKESKPVTAPRPSLSRRVSSGDLAGTLYKMLSLCKLNATHGPENHVSISDVADPSSVPLALVDYDFQAEERILQASGK